MDVARLNFSHGDHEVHLKSLKNLREAMAARPGCHCAVLLDTKGPEIRSGFLKGHRPVHLKVCRSGWQCEDRSWKDASNEDCCFCMLGRRLGWTDTGDHDGLWRGR